MRNVLSIFEHTLPLLAIIIVTVNQSGILGNGIMLARAASSLGYLEIGEASMYRSYLYYASHRSYSPSGPHE